MKKILITLVFIFLLTGCKNGNIKNISYDDLLKKIENKESFILYFDEENSKNLKNTLNKVLEKNNLNAYTINTSKLNQDKINNLRLKIDYEEPSITFIIEGNDPSVITHIKDEYITENEIEERLRDMNFIK